MSISGLYPVAVTAYGDALPCWSVDPDLFFAESPSDVERAKALCQGCPARLPCLAGALQGANHGVSGAANCSITASSSQRSAAADAHANNPSRHHIEEIGNLEHFLTNLFRERVEREP
jgi:Transcription factor WhiB